jgi:hypothetical protein
MERWNYVLFTSVGQVYRGSETGINTGMNTGIKSNTRPV